MSSKIEERLAAVEQALKRLGVDVGHSVENVESTPAMTCINNGVVVEAILRDLWKRLNLKGPAAKKQLDALLTTTSQKLEQEDRPIPRRIHDYIRAIQLTRNRAAHHMDATPEDAAESLRHLSEVSFWYFVEFLGQSASSDDESKAGLEGGEEAEADVAPKSAAATDVPKAETEAREEPQVDVEAVVAATVAQSAEDVVETEEAASDTVATSPFGQMTPSDAASSAPLVHEDDVALDATKPDAEAKPAPHPLILALAIVDFILGGICTLGGLIMMLGASISTGADDAKYSATTNFVMGTITVVPQLLFAAAFVAVGIGLLRRRSWALLSSRILALVALGVSFVMLCLSYIPLLVAICYCVTVYVLSYRKSFAAQFQG
jgi:hypothetical protein